MLYIFQCIDFLDNMIFTRCQPHIDMLKDSL